VNKLETIGNVLVDVPFYPESGHCADIAGLRIRAMSRHSNTYYGGHPLLLDISLADAAVAKGPPRRRCVASSLRISPVSSISLKPVFTSPMSCASALTEMPTHSRAHHDALREQFPWPQKA
jgi:hypothetical protein